MTARIRKAWSVSCVHFDESDIVYAPNAGKARVQVWRNSESTKITDWRVVRSRCNDDHLPAPDPLATLLTNKERDALMHSYGLNEFHPERSGWRDHYCTDWFDTTLNGLVGYGLTRRQYSRLIPSDKCLFILTKRGRAVAASLVPEYGV
jgi:hypothetical protein